MTNLHALTCPELDALCRAQAERIGALERERVRTNASWNAAFNWLYVALTNRLEELDRTKANFEDSRQRLRRALRWVARLRPAREIATEHAFRCAARQNALKRARAALAYYANSENYERNPAWCNCGAEWWHESLVQAEDQGRRARTALAGVAQDARGVDSEAAALQTAPDRHPVDSAAPDVEELA